MVRRSRSSSSKRVLRSPSLRGMKPSKVKRSVGRPDTASALSTADGPGTIVTSTPASAQARTRLKPGSLTVGMPASLTTKRSCSRATSTSCSSRSRSLWSCKLKVLALIFTPRACANLKRVRVSSAAMKREPNRCSTRRGEASERFPMGVAARISTAQN